MGKNIKEAEHQDLTDRLVMNLVFEVSQIADDIEQLKICIYGLARQRGLVKKQPRRHEFAPS